MYVGKFLLSTWSFEFEDTQDISAHFFSLHKLAVYSYHYDYKMTTELRDNVVCCRHNNSSDSRDSSSYKPFSSRDETSSTTGSKYGIARNRLSDDDIPSRYGQTRAKPYESDSTTSRYGNNTRAGTETPSYTSRFLNKSKSTAMVSPEDEKDESSLYSSGRTRFAAMKDRKARLARSKSSHTLMPDDEEFDDGPNSPYSPAAYLASKAAASSSSVSDFPRTELTRSRSSHTLKSRENSPDRSTYSSNASAGISLPKLERATTHWRQQWMPLAHFINRI